MSETKTEEIKTLPGLGLPELLPYLKPYRKTLIAMLPWWIPSCRYSTGMH